MFSDARGNQEVTRDGKPSFVPLGGRIPEVATKLGEQLGGVKPFPPDVKILQHEPGQNDRPEKFNLVVLEYRTGDSIGINGVRSGEINRESVEKLIGPGHLPFPSQQFHEDSSASPKKNTSSLAMKAFESGLADKPEPNRQTNDPALEL